jgi:site-specific DNA-cytosine methylase
MGNHHGLEDRRSRAFLRLLKILEEAPPERLVLENVPGFRGSDGHQRLVAILDHHGFHHLEWDVCPTQFGIPNLRSRFFLVASRQPLSPLAIESMNGGAIGAYLDTEEDFTLYLDDETLARHGWGMDFVVAEDRRSTCFIGGYAGRYVGSGSFLRTARGVRRFSPSEIARIMGLPDAFRFPGGVSLDQQYKLLGNGLNIHIARWVVKHLRA